MFPLGIHRIISIHRNKRVLQLYQITLLLLHVLDVKFLSQAYTAFHHCVVAADNFTFLLHFLSSNPMSGPGDNKRLRSELDTSTNSDDMGNSEILKTLKEMEARFTSKLDSIESSIELRLGSKIDDLKSSLSTTIHEVKAEFNQQLNTVSSSVDHRFDAVNENHAKVENRCDKISSVVMQMESNYEPRLCKLERQSLLNELIVTGVPIEKRKNLDDVVADICEALQVDLRQSDFSSIFRLPSKKTANQNADNKAAPPSPIILRFNYSWAKDCFLNAYFKKKTLNLKDIGFKTAKRIYVNESLTTQNRQIFRQALLAKNANQIHRCFTRQGLVYIEATSSSKSVRITNKNDLEKFLHNTNSESAEHHSMET